MRKNKHYFIKKNCETCSNEFLARKDAVKIHRVHNRYLGRGRFCSRTCQGKSYWKKGHRPWNAGTKGLTKANKTSFKKKKWQFTGTKLEYITLHNKIRKQFGTPDTCEHCHKSNLTGRKIHWANKTGSYLLTREDWIRLCAKCHYLYDGRAK